MWHGNIKYETWRCPDGNTKYCTSDRKRTEVERSILIKILCLTVIIIERKTRENQHYTCLSIKVMSLLAWSISIGYNVIFSSSYSILVATFSVSLLCILLVAFIHRIMARYAVTNIDLSRAISNFECFCSRHSIFVLQS